MVHAIACVVMLSAAEIIIHRATRRQVFRARWLRITKRFQRFKMILDGHLDDTSYERNGTERNGSGDPCLEEAGKQRHGQNKGSLRHRSP